MCTALTDDDPFDLCAAVGTGFAFTIIHPKVILEFSAAIDPVNGCAVSPDAFPEDFADRFAQRLGLTLRHRIRCGERMQFGEVQRLVGVDVA